MTSKDLFAILPLIIVVAWAMLLLLADLWIPKEKKWMTALLAACGLAISLGFSLAQGGRNVVAFGGMAIQDGFATSFNIIFLVSGIVGVALAYDYLKRMNIERGEYYVLLLFTISGMMLMAYAYDLIVVFLALELLSIPLYVMAGFARPRLDSEESALKYFLLGAFAGGFVLYGTALIFGATTHTDLAGIVQHFSPISSLNGILLLVGAGLLLVGFGFKIAAVPFQMWTPDVYQGAPSPVTGFMSIGAKAAGFAALLRVFMVAFPSIAADITPVLWGLAALTMVVGNVVAIAQTNIKRLLAYSSIAHAGYMLMAFVPQGQGTLNAVPSIVFYLAVYAFTSLGAWAVVIALEQAEGKGLDIIDYAGLGKKHPILALDRKSVV
jgi:NADH-quinone oxidoreductase subunit N